MSALAAVFPVEADRPELCQDLGDVRQILNIVLHRLVRCADRLTIDVHVPGEVYICITTDITIYAIPRKTPVDVVCITLKDNIAGKCVIPEKVHITQRLRDGAALVRCHRKKLTAVEVGRSDKLKVS